MGAYQLLSLFARRLANESFEGCTNACDHPGVLHCPFGINLCSDNQIDERVSVASYVAAALETHFFRSFISVRLLEVPINSEAMDRCFLNFARRRRGFDAKRSPPFCSS
jgi:hypothetical protein